MKKDASHRQQVTWTLWMSWKARHVGTTVDVRGRWHDWREASGAGILPSRRRGNFRYGYGTITRLAAGRAMRIRALGVRLQHCRAILRGKAVRAAIVKQPSRLQQIEGPTELRVSRRRIPDFAPSATAYDGGTVVPALHLGFTCPRATCETMRWGMSPPHMGRLLGGCDSLDGPSDRYSSAHDRYLPSAVGEQSAVHWLLRVTRTHRIVARDQSETSNAARSRQCGYHVANMTTCGIANATKQACTHQDFATEPS
jgi:hypothetical protein